MARAKQWAQLEAFETEYCERLEREAKQSDSQFIAFLRGLAQNRKEFWADEINARDEETGRLFALRNKILTLREKLGEPEIILLPIETALLPKPDKGDKKEKPRRVRYIADPLPEGYLYPVTFDEIRALLTELPKDHAATVHEIRLSHQKRTGSDADWCDGEIRLHCMAEAVREHGELTALRRPLGRREGTQDTERFGGRVQWEGNTAYAVWSPEAFKTFVLRRVLVHEIAHGVAELPGYAEAVRSAGSVERFCELYAENFYKPPGRSMRLNY
jgi:hypothetical protein